MTVDTQPFLRGTRIYPQPIAVACDRVYRSRTPSEQVDAILKCAEIVARYVAALALSSFSARSDTSVAPSPIIQSFKGKLTFGSFTKVAEEVYGLAGVHPLGVLFDTAWRGQQPASEWAETALNQLRQIRNDIGHDLANLSEVDARAMLEQKMPHELLTLVLKRFDALLSLPVFIIEAHELEHTNLYAQQVVLMGASADPLPERVELPIGTGAIPRRIPFVGYPDGILCLEPFLIWDIAPNKGNFALYFVHEIEAGQVVYQSVGKDERSKGGQLREEIARRVERGDIVSAKAIAPIGSTSFYARWQSQREIAEQSSFVLVSWGELDAATVAWYGAKLGVAGSPDDIHSTIRAQLLDGREFLHADEMRQLQILFGREETVRRLVGRPLIDCRAPVKDDPAKRFDRVEVNRNLVEGLRASIAFVSSHIGGSGITIDGLKATSGTANYIAMREALVNLLIHQDYTNQKMAGQVILEHERATFVNPGAALISQTELIEGNVNGSRNPLLSRALKLIGFAELAGSGLGAIYDAWRGAKRRPPVVESSPERNTFRLALDWRTLPMVVDKFWKETIGVSLSPVEAATVLLASEPKGTTLEVIAIAHGMRLDDVSAMVRKLVVNEMIAEINGKIVVHEKRREQVQRAKAQGEMLNQLLSTPLAQE